MAAQVNLFIGPVRSGKTYELLRQYRAALDVVAPARLDRAIWLAPRSRAAAAVREQLVPHGLTACLRPNVLTFDDLTKQILFGSNRRVKRLDSVLRHDLLRHVIAHELECSCLSFFAESATRSGFIDLLAEHIAELQRRDISPRAYATATSRRAADQSHSELARLYTAYDALLSKYDLIDADSAYSAACGALVQKTGSRFEKLELIVVDGFTDFTRTQLALIDVLSQRADQVFISLPAEHAVEHQASARSSDHTSRPDLFAKTTATVRDLQQQFPDLKIRRFEPRPLPCPAIDHITRQIFRNPQHVVPPTAAALESLSQIEIVEATGNQDEIVQIARRVKCLLTGTPAEKPTRPGEILVVFRSLTDVAPRIREVFDRFGIPYSLDAAPPITASPLIKTLVQVLLLDQEDWRFRRVVSVVTSNSISTFDGDARCAADWLVRDLQIASGRSALLNRVQSLATDSTAPADRSDHLQRRVTAAAAAQPALLELAAALDALPTKATPTQWCDALARLGTSLSISPTFANESASRSVRLVEGRSDTHDGPRPSTTQGVPPDFDSAAWNIVAASFAALERLDAWIDQPPRELSRGDLLTTLRDIITHEPLPRTHAEAGRVRILDTLGARNTSARHLFLAGMSEQAFPSTERPGRLATDAEYHELEHKAHRQTHCSATASATRAQAEMLLFYEMLGRAQESLTISYSALDDKAQALPPSPYVIELERVLGSDGLKRIQRAKPQLSPIASATTAYSIPDWRIQAVARAIDKDADARPLAAIFACPETRPLAGAIDAGLRIVHARAHGQSFGAAEGLLTSSAIAARLTERFGPKHTWSVSQWETYATCPFRFFMEVVLDLEPLGDLVLETDFARRGSRLHDVLAAFHRQWLTLRPKHLAADEEAAAFLARLQQ
ncbi:MAG TPA: PD-(D/E)XK nuclease family protein, partial [Lacipirellulaceae bacterium]|nr:PD-(D/E)XK nuclease family protein [Lacipirellulaceae bacterium]